MEVLVWMPLNSCITTGTPSWSTSDRYMVISDVNGMRSLLKSLINQSFLVHFPIVVVQRIHISPLSPMGVNPFVLNAAIRRGARHHQRDLTVPLHQLNPPFHPLDQNLMNWLPNVHLHPNLLVKGFSKHPNPSQMIAPKHTYDSIGWQQRWCLGIYQQDQLYAQ